MERDLHYQNNAGVELLPQWDDANVIQHVVLVTVGMLTAAATSRPLVTGWEDVCGIIEHAECYHKIVHQSKLSCLELAPNVQSIASKASSLTPTWISWKRRPLLHLKLPFVAVCSLLLHASFPPSHIWPSYLYPQPVPAHNTLLLLLSLPAQTLQGF